MPRFYFHLNNGDGYTPDHEGHDYPDEVEATGQAVKEVRALIAADVLSGHPILMSSFIEVDDENGVRVGRVNYSETVSFV